MRKCGVTDAIKATGERNRENCGYSTIQNLRCQGPYRVVWSEKNQKQFANTLT